VFFAISHLPSKSTSRSDYFFLPDGVCDSALAAAVFSVFVEVGLDKTLLAAEAAFELVWREFVPI